MCAGVYYAGVAHQLLPLLKIYFALYDSYER